MLLISFKLAKSNITYRKERTLLTMFSISFSILISFILLSIVQGFLSIVEKSLKNKNVEFVITTKEIPIEIGPIIINPSINSIPMKLYNTLLLYNITLTPVFKSIINIENKLVPIIAIDFNQINSFYPSLLPSDQNSILVGKKLQNVITKSSININGIEFQVSYINKELNGYEDYSVFIDFRKYMQLSNKKNIDQIWVNQLIDKKTILDILKQYQYLGVFEYHKINYIQSTLINSLKILQVIMIIASISIALIASTNTILITTFERIPDFTIILAIGAPRSVVFTSLLLEGLILSTISSLIGIFLGVISTSLVAYSIQTALNISIPLMANIFLIINQIALISIFIGICSSIIPAYIASTVNIQENIRIT